MLRVSEIFIYPIKSLSGIPVPSAVITDRGFQFDRRWMLVNEKNILTPSLILDQVRRNVIKILNQQYSSSDSRDGMDMALCSLDVKNRKMQFAGAFNPVWIIRDKQLIELRGDKFPVGTFIGNELPPFSNLT